MFVELLLYHGSPTEKNEPNQSRSKQTMFSPIVDLETHGMLCLG